MQNNIKIADKLIGDGYPCYIVAEIGINHNGSLDIAKQLIDVAVGCGCDAVKFQKRTIESVYSPEELLQPRESPFGSTTGDLKRGLEFGYEQYAQIFKYCQDKRITCFTSCWDEGSVDFMEQFNSPCYKIASACLTNDNLLRYHRKLHKPIILSTGMSDMPMIERAVNILGKEDLVVLHCVSTYPSKVEELNLRRIVTLKQKFPDIPIGYSGHEVGLATTYAAVALGASVVERHITLDRAMWGSDQAASIEPTGLKRLVRDIRCIESALGDGVLRIVDSEKSAMAKLRRVHTR